MKCPACGFNDSKVVDSRPTENSSIRRRRECLSCQKRFTTYEIIETVPIIVIKKDKRREQFDRNKIRSGIMKACYKRPVTNEQIDAVISEIEGELQNMLRSEITSEELGIVVMNKLKKLDEVSYVRFASVYRHFKDVETFMRELMELKAGREAAGDGNADGNKSGDGKCE